MLGRDLQFWRQIKDEAEGDIDLFVDGHEELPNFGQPIVGGIGFCCPGYHQPFAFAPAQRLRFKRPLRFVQREVAFHHKLRGLVFGRAGWITLEQLDFIQLETELGIHLNMKPVKHVAVTSAFKRSHLCRLNIDLGAEDNLRLFGINLRASAELFRLTVKVVHEGMPRELEEALLYIKRHFDGVREAGEKESENQRYDYFHRLSF